ncbi:hypothetical protein Xszus_03787 [Xenorhabdus szentirmaii]|nr:hypothetical protein Xsze_01630 [Xenorhabdus szentirmaii DSM 16338]PHM43969.1 hypothetical protein Xszus_03787 [Xenorhabdus szentirmaii]
MHTYFCELNHNLIRKLCGEYNSEMKEIVEGQSQTLRTKKRPLLGAIMRFKEQD